MPTFTPPTVSYAWPTGSRLLDRVPMDRGLCVITDGAGGWTTQEFPYEGDLGYVNPVTSAVEGLVDGVTYFLGGHIYYISCALGDSLQAAGFTVSDLGGTYPGESVLAEELIFPSDPC